MPGFAFEDSSRFLAIHIYAGLITRLRTAIPRRRMSLADGLIATGLMVSRSLIVNLVFMLGSPWRGGSTNRTGATLIVQADPVSMSAGMPSISISIDLKTSGWTRIDH
jgi:hypothetical protein